ncbi:hypothetical protein INT43_001594 [Umbelopsis isabellina]|uniref:Natural resistance-associated macrophage protein n=1 Tax=Mortierella isabellina TaxID=91625 RepID=A0A8H7UG80_MORIS|nr:hypothetical protein INT43_001594 [Umbelopsis isabellina]
MLKTRSLLDNVKQTLLRFLRFVGPGFIIAVGYLDPGNWASDAQAGSDFGYKLLFVILMSNIVAIYLQYLAIRLGTVSGLDLAQACRKFLPRWLNFILYLLCEAAIVSCDLAEVIGSAIAFNLLFGLALPIGVAITAADVIIILFFYKDNTKSMRIVRVFEGFVMILVTTVGICFVIELVYSKPVAVDVLKGYVPTKELFTDPAMLYIAISIIGATVMPQYVSLYFTNNIIISYMSNSFRFNYSNLYLHSSLVQARCYQWKDSRPTSEEEIDLLESRKVLDAAIKTHLRYSFWDLFVALLFAFFVNCAILIVFSANFYYGPTQTSVGDLFTAHDLLQQYLGPAAAVIFALALLCSGQSSTLTATMAGQIVMSGFLGLNSRPWLRRLVTRLIAIVPAMIAAIVSGKDGINNMLIASQVALSIQLPFAIVPLVVFTGMKRVMTISVYNDSETSTCPDIAVDDDLLSERSKTDKSIKSRSHSTAPSSVHVCDATLDMDTVTEAPIQTASDIKKSQSIHEIDEASNNEIAPLVFANNKLMNVVSGIVALVIICLNAYLVITLFMGTASA